MKCPNCGCEAQDGAEYCLYCGFIFPLNVYASTGQTVLTRTNAPTKRRARRAKGIFLDYHDVVVVLLFLILLLEIIQLLVMIG